MRFWTAYLFLAFGLASKAYSSGGGAHHGSINDLLAPAVNVLLLLGFLGWKLKKPMADHFNKLATDISNTLERASLKSKEAKMMLDNEEKKISNLASEVKTINTQADSDVVTFEKKLAKETEEKTHKLKTDATMKIAADKKAVMDALNAELLEQVVSKTKSTIKGNKDFQSKASSKLLQGLN